ncbi:biotin/lipoyl-binding protein [Chlorobium sp. BLA1]|uniref:biotin/lipoyl-containing protein n=1 Tax=Candidatus Chlorobium masyuteum TaxID=2716876 RepID=UPI0014247CBA|nr:acetyl-CoA carboxylase biotin carboxyl carrier protein subunit [Candidatus Chlorobium masyuteum]NHQ61202.1 biotin/lipoyl-binding protein [Candidatus Chlorobium masyuteum]NTU44444.1 biotin/lipoyl-binding protein [Chlorobiaceae bacterium]
MRKYKFTISGNRYNVEIKSFEENSAEIEVNGTSYQVELGQEIKRPQTPKLVRYTPPTPPKPPEPLITQGLSIIKAPLPGTIIALMVQVGSPVKREEPILVLEAMKMENNIFAEKAGTVKSVRVAVGDTVMQGDILIEIE